jgi:hypothetical protein
VVSQHTRKTVLCIPRQVNSNPKDYSRGRQLGDIDRRMLRLLGEGIRLLRDRRWDIRRGRRLRRCILLDNVLWAGLGSMRIN